jgi:hypothetical protein
MNGGVLATHHEEIEAELLNAPVKRARVAMRGRRKPTRDGRCLCPECGRIHNGVKSDPKGQYKQTPKGRYLVLCPGCGKSREPAPRPYEYLPGQR